MDEMSVAEEDVRATALAEKMHKQFNSGVDASISPLSWKTESAFMRAWWTRIAVVAIEVVESERIECDRTNSYAVDALETSPRADVKVLALAVNLLRYAHSDVVFNTQEDADEQRAVLDQVQECVASLEGIIEQSSGTGYRAPRPSPEPKPLRAEVVESSPLQTEVQ